MSAEWPALPYEQWHDTCDTLHAHAQVLGKLAVALAPPEPQLQHAALRLTARGWETAPLPAPDGSGALVAALDLRRHEAVAEHTTGGERRIAPTPQEVDWSVALDADDEHATYDPGPVAAYFAAATRVALALAAFRA